MSIEVNFFQIGARYGFISALLLHVKNNNPALLLEVTNLQERLDNLRESILSQQLSDINLIRAILIPLQTEIDELYDRS